ncbi:MAG: hypothetical protein SO003_04315 [Candidatus Borkfalkiaceae bacterium]|nr:hypothetical protein [Christensenellaceae bacterium]
MVISPQIVGVSNEYARQPAAIPPKKCGTYTPQTSTLPGDCFAPLAKTIKQPVIASASVAIPVNKVRGIYSVLYSDRLPQSLLPYSTIKANALQKPNGF